MHFREIIHGKAFIGGPFLLYLLFTLIHENDLHGQDVNIIRNQDPIVYILKIDVENSGKKSAWDNTKEFVSQLKYPGKIENGAIIDETIGTIKTQFGFYLYQETAFLKNVDGAIFADLDVELQMSQVVTTIRNIYFIDYARDRYGKFSPKTTKKYSLEDLIEKRKSDTWKGHFITVDENIRLLLSNLEKSVFESKEVSIK